jgi:hypothetical protein
LPYADPIVIGPPLVDSSAMLVAAAAQFPQWALDSALVRVVWEPGDPLLRQMAHINTMLFGLNGYRLAQLQALADVQAHLEQQAAVPLDASPPLRYPPGPSPRPDHAAPGPIPHRQQAHHPSFADLFRRSRSPQGDS